MNTPTSDSPALSYQYGFGNMFSSEARPGALPVGRNSPQRAPYGLYAELLSGTAFTAPRAHNQRTWMYRIRPSAMHGPLRAHRRRRSWTTGPFIDAETPPNRLALERLAGAADRRRLRRRACSPSRATATPHAQTGMAAHSTSPTARWSERYFVNADGELLIVPQAGPPARRTPSSGVLEVAPGEIAVVPRGMRFRVELPDGAARGYVCENYGAPFRLPELGPIGSNGLANARDFLAPVAAYEDRDGAVRAGQQVPGPPVGRRASTIRRSTWSPGTATTRRTSTTWRASRHRHGQLRPPRPVDLHGAHLALRHAGHRPTATS